MRKIYRISQIHKIIGPYICGLDMYKYGLPYNGAAGSIYPNQPDLIDLMFAAVERHPELHVVTNFCDGTCVNRYEEQNALSYNLHLGNADPAIEFTDDRSEDDHLESSGIEDFQIDLRAMESLAPVQVAAINWICRAIKPR